jgi:hypothetical protein
MVFRGAPSTALAAVRLAPLRVVNEPGAKSPDQRRLIIDGRMIDST